MKSLLTKYLLPLCAMVALLYIVKMLTDLWLRSQHADIVDAEQFRTKCLDARKGFFEDCYRWHGPADCTALWAQTRGRVFDGDPVNRWTDEINCSQETK